jgi:hypothetical protein
MSTRNEIFDALVARPKDRLVPRMVKSVARGLDGFPRLLLLQTILMSQQGHSSQDSQIRCLRVWW